MPKITINKILKQGYVYFKFNNSYARGDKNGYENKIYKGYLFSYTTPLSLWESIEVAFGIEYCYNFKDNIKVYDVEYNEIKNKDNNELAIHAFCVKPIIQELCFKESLQDAMGYRWALTKEELECQQ